MPDAQPQEPIHAAAKAAGSAALSPREYTMVPRALFVQNSSGADTSDD